jgi:hypothetical protein
MTRWIIAIGVGLLMLCEMLFAAPHLFAQTPGGPFDRMSPGNQKITRALFEAQTSQPPPGSRPLTLDQIAARKQSGAGWGRVFDGMKSQGLVDSKNLGQTVSSFNQRHHVSSAGAVTTAANRTVHSNGVNAARNGGPKTGHGDQGRGAVTAGHTQTRGAAASGPVHSTAATGGASHGGGRSK